MTRALSESLVLYMGSAVALAGTWRTPGALCVWLVLCLAVERLAAEARDQVEDCAGLVAGFVVVAFGWLALLAAPWLPLVKGLG